MQCVFRSSFEWLRTGFGNAQGSERLSAKAPSARASCGCLPSACGAAFGGAAAFGEWSEAFVKISAGRQPASKQPTRQ
jgi:hypothetical protein